MGGVRRPSVRFLLSTVLTLVCALPARADEIPFSVAVKASLVFRDDFDAARRYPHILKVYLRLDNVHDSEVPWVANSTRGIEAELLDAAGKPAARGPQAASILSSESAYLLPFGSRLDWLVSHGGISLVGNATDKYALMIGGRGWLIPIETATSYSLRIRLRGLPWTRAGEAHDLKVLLDIPPTRLEVIK
jgi:hypothetical protein